MASLTHTMTDVSERRSGRPVRVWLWTVAALVFAMIVVGGATRLTDSGLSITEWKPILGAVPPLSAEDWQDAFQKYKQIPEYDLVNKGMSLSEFKTIFWWEWAHRFLGRFIGVVFALVFLADGALARGVAAQAIRRFCSRWPPGRYWLVHGQLRIGRSR